MSLSDLHISSEEQSTEDNIYYNIRQYCPLDAPLPVKSDYKSNRVVPVVKEPNNYEMAVERFSIPSNFPLFIWPEADDTYKVQLKWKTSSVTKNVSYTDPCVGCFYPRGIYHLHTLIDILNTALEEARTELKILDPTFPSTKPIFFAWDAPSQLFSLYVESSFGASPDFDLKMQHVFFLSYFNTFESVGDYSGPDLPIKLVIENRILNITQVGATSYLQIQQAQSSISDWNQASLISFETNMPVSGELSATVKNVTETVLTDFSIAGVDTYRGYINFFPQGPLRYYDLTSKYPMTSVDLKAFITYADGTRYPLYLNRGEHLSMKLQFRRK